MFPFLLAILFDFSFKELERFSFAVQLYLFSLVSSFKDGLFKVFQFCIASSLALSACFPVCFGTAKVRIFFDFCKKFFLFFLRPFQLSFFFASYLLFSFLAALRYPVAFCNSRLFWDCKGENLFSFPQEVFCFFFEAFYSLLLLVFALFSVFKSCLALLSFFPTLSVWDCKGETFFRLCKENLSFFKTLDHCPCLSVLYFFPAVLPHTLWFLFICFLSNHLSKLSTFSSTVKRIFKVFLNR